jgi:hypothetical protein
MDVHSSLLEVQYIICKSCFQISSSKVAEIRKYYSKLHTEASGELHSSPNLIQKVKSGRNGSVCDNNGEINAFTFLLLKPQGNNAGDALMQKKRLY